MTSDDGQDLQRALDLGYAYVNRRDRTVSEIRRHLERRGLAADVRDAAVRTLANQGLLDDRRFAALFVEDKRNLEQWGNDRIRRGLLARGVDAEQVEAALAAPPAGSEEPVGELDRALALLRQRFPHPPADPRERQRAFGVLVRKGYDSEIALDALSAHARRD